MSSNIIIPDSNSSFTSSHEKLTALWNAAHSYSAGSMTLVLPERPVNSEADSKRFFNGAISMLCESTAYLYNDRLYLDSRFDGLSTQVDSFDRKVGNHFKYTQKQFTNLQDDVKDIKRSTKRSFDMIDGDIKIIKDDLGLFKESVKAEFKAAREDLRGFKNSVKTEFTTVKTDITTVKADLKAVQDDLKAVQDDLGAFKHEVRAEFKAVKEDIKAVKEDIKAVKEDIKAVKEDIKAVKEDVHSLKNEVSAMARNRLVTRLIHPIEKVRAPIRDANGVLKYEVASEFPPTVRRFWVLGSNVAALQRLAKYYSVDGWEDWKMDSSEDEVDSTQYIDPNVAVAAHPELCLQVLAIKWGLEYSQLERPGRQMTDFEDVVRKRKADDESVSRKVRRKQVDEISTISDESEEVVRKSVSGSEPEPKMLPTYTQVTIEELRREFNIPGESIAGDSADLRWGSDTTTHALKHHIRAQMGLDPPVPGPRDR